MKTEIYRRNYHCLIPILFHSNMLSPEQINQIPRSTRSRWNKFNHEDYFGYDMVKDYIDDFDHIKNLLTNKHIKQGVKFMTAISFGYKNVIAEVENNKKLLIKHADRITHSINEFAKYGKLTKTQVCKLFGVSKDWFYRHRDKKNCEKSKIGKCYRQYPNQLTFEEVNMIQKVISKSENRMKTKTSLFYDSIRSGIIACGISTFFKYANLLGYQKPKKEKIERPRGFRATKPFEWLHVDVTYVQTQTEGMQYVALVKDNYSKALLGYKTIPRRPTSHFIRELFEEVFLKYKLLDSKGQINILSDGGSENKGALIDWINQIDAPPVVQKLTANTKEFPFSNSMSESTHSIYKTEYMQKKHSFNRQQHEKDLAQFVEYYNNERFPFEHFGLTPMEVLEGQKPFRGRFAPQIQEARANRLEANRNFNACPLACL